MAGDARIMRVIARRVVVAAVVVMTVVAWALGIPAIAAAQPEGSAVEVQEVHTVWTAEFGVARPGGLAYDPSRGEFLVAGDARQGTKVLRLGPDEGNDVSSASERFAVPGGGAPQVIAFNPADDLLYVMDAQGSTLKAVDRAGEVQKTVSVESTDLSAPVAMVFAPSTDPTDDPEAQHLFVADSGGDTTLGGVTELSLAASEVTAASVDSATLVQTIDTSSWVPASPDPAGIVWMRGADELAVVDSEVDETTGAGWNDVNLWRSTRTGDVAGVGALWGSNSAGSYSKEPTGLGYDEARDVLFVSDDSAGKIFVVRRGGDGVFGTSDDVVGSVDAEGYGSTDTEDPEFDPASGHLFFLDGRGREIYRVDPVDTVWGNADDKMTHFDISHLGPADFEGLSSNPGRGTLLVGARTTEEIYEITLDGTLVRRIDVPVSQMRYISGLGVAPASNGSSQTNLWIVDRAVDNGADPNENDGKIFEIAASDIGAPRENAAPVVESVTIDQSSPGTDDTVSATVSASDADGDTLTYGYQWVNDGVDITGATGATLDLSVAGSGDKGDEIAVRATASDGVASSDPVTSSPVTVADSPPVFDQDLGDQTSREGDTVSLSAAATDPDGDALTYAASGLPVGVTIDASTGVVSGTVADGAAANSPYDVSITVRDGTTVDATDTFTWTVAIASPDNAAPVVDALQLRITNGRDDAEEAASGSVSYNNGDLELVQEKSLQTVGLRFPGLAVPHGATIVSATVQFKADETDEVATDLAFRAQAADNAPTFNTDAHNISSRPLTAASAAWSPAPWTTVGAAGPDQETSDISAVIQEVVDRPGWASGNALVLVVTGSGKRVAESYNGDAAGAPLRRVTYSIN